MSPKKCYSPYASNYKKCVEIFPYDLNKNKTLNVHTNFNLKLNVFRHLVETNIIEIKFFYRSRLKYIALRLKLLFDLFGVFKRLQNSSVLTKFCAVLSQNLSSISWCICRVYEMINEIHIKLKRKNALSEMRCLER